MISNPEYKGKWKAPMIANPNYKGIWKPRMIPNPYYFEDLEPYKMTPIVGFLHLYSSIAQCLNFLHLVFYLFHKDRSVFHRYNLKNLWNWTLIFHKRVQLAWNFGRWAMAFSLTIFLSLMTLVWQQIMPRKLGIWRRWFVLNPRCEVHLVHVKCGPLSFSSLISAV